MSGIGEQRDRIGHDAKRDLQHHQPDVERGYDRERKTEVLGRVTMPVIMRMRRMIALTVIVLTVIMFVVVVLTVAVIVLVRGHAQPIAEMMSVTLSP
jgi:hypothetical protein